MTIVLTIVTILLCCTGCIVLHRRRTAVYPRTERTISIVVPARNEAHNLPRLLSSIQPYRALVRDIVVVDDASTDATPDIAHSFGATVVQPPPLQAGWTGKAWACHHGAQSTDADVLCFLDADTWFEGRALPGLLERYRPGTVLSVLPYHRVVAWYEQASLFFNLLMAMGSDAFTIGTATPRLFGQCMVVDRDAYIRVGGHAAVRGQILENFHMTDLFFAHGIPTASIAGRDILAMRMYTGGLAQVIQGWSKAFTRGAGASRPYTVLLTSLWLTGMIVAPALFVLGPWYGLAAWIAACSVLVTMRPLVGTYRPWAVLLYPIPLSLFVVVFFRALILQRRGTAVAWKGRSVDQPGIGDA
ncbi:MAG: glycosyltransferase ['Candidatus Kapabacteria' thiocyanatum]|uniref:Glycosyltransferase 2-like domain-containing protein n=1 Tax=Candidatus Kapaibacterium thiocyanatum TaxID=1895771 RepID=A0A1M3L3N4_9BACT|nr:glycosyltransferase ['Candidatus Kapabacteria' thiocyanatum]OJX59969.1 MAG: hypothetical protein BGO89_08225 ['Candidatus Kapabacteria' thiocyanatum]